MSECIKEAVGKISEFVGGNVEIISYSISRKILKFEISHIFSGFGRLEIIIVGCERINAPTKWQGCLIHTEYLASIKSVRLVDYTAGVEIIGGSISVTKHKV